jgi:hypothetical protein
MEPCYRFLLDPFRNFYWFAYRYADVSSSVMSSPITTRQKLPMTAKRRQLELLLLLLLLLFAVVVFMNLSHS